jgi:ubiquitin-conjugating enzyme (huntingtin interacting protein 2)
MAAANGRLRKELNEVGKVDKSSGVSAAAVGDGSDLSHLKGKINGPESTCYDGGIFEIDIRIPKQYPFEPPKVGDKFGLVYSVYDAYTM